MGLRVEDPVVERDDIDGRELRGITRREYDEDDGEERRRTYEEVVIFDRLGEDKRLH